MKQNLNEIRINNSTVILKDNLVRSGILPEKAAELERNIIVKGDTVVEGAMFGKRITIENGDLECQGAVFAVLELYIDTDATGEIEFKKAVASADSITSRASKCDLTFRADINAKTVALYNALVTGSIYADEVTLENCVVLGGVFATQTASLKDTIVGTFNSPVIRLDGRIGTLLPSAFSIERPLVAPGTVMYNYTLADLGALYRGVPEDPNSGKIRIDFDADEMRTTLTDDEGVQKQLRSYTVIGKVLAADMLDTEKFQNHFLLSAASLGPQMLRVYDLGTDADGNPVALSPVRLRDFFKGLLSGKIDPREMSGKFDITKLVK